MTSVEDVAIEVGASVETVLAACDDLDIVASTARSGLSADEHRRLRQALGASADLPPVVGGSQTRDPDAIVEERSASIRERHDALVAEAARPKPRWDIKTATRVAIGAFLLAAVGVAVVALNGRIDDPVSILGFSAGDVGSCYDVDESGGPLLTEADCAVAHDVELVGVLPVDEAVLPAPPSTALDDAADDSTTTTLPFPGEVALFEQAEPACEAAFEDHVGVPAAESSFSIALLIPTPETWAAGDRAILCLAENPTGPIVGPVAG